MWSRRPGGVHRRGPGGLRLQAIQVGRYRLRQHLPAQTALAALLDDDNRLVGQPVTLPEGLTVKEIVQRIADRTRFSEDSLTSALSRIKLPPYANGNPEGYLFPATYNVTRSTTPTGLFKAMVTRFERGSRGCYTRAAKADAMGRTPGEIITVASLVQAEARRQQDFAKVARVVYNRLGQGMPLELDSTVHYAVGKDGSVSTTPEDRGSTRRTTHTRMSACRRVRSTPPVTRQSRRR